MNGYDIGVHTKDDSEGMKAGQVVEESTVIVNWEGMRILIGKGGEERRDTEVHTTAMIWVHDWEPLMMIKGETG